MDFLVVLEDDYVQMLRIIKAMGAIYKESGLFACCFKPKLLSASP